MPVLMTTYLKAASCSCKATQTGSNCPDPTPRAVRFAAAATQIPCVQVENALANLDGTLTTASQYLGSQPSLAQAIIGYQTVQSSHPLSLLRTQTQLNTSDILGANNASSYSLPLTIVVAGGNTAKVSAVCRARVVKLLHRMRNCNRLG